MATPDKTHWMDWRVALLILYVALTALVMTRHEMWRDELEFWVEAKESRSLSGLRWRIRDLGHPHLWPVALWLVSRLHPHPPAMQALHLLVAAAAVAIVLWRAPFRPLQKALFCFGYFPFYEYAVISRNYGLGLLCLVALCALANSHPWRYPAIALALLLLVQANPYAAILAGAFGVSLLVAWYGDRNERRRPAPALGAAALAVLAAAAAARQMMPTHESIYYPEWRAVLRPSYVAQAVAAVWRGLVPVPWPDSHFWNSSLLQESRLLEAALGVAFLAVGAWLVRRRAPALVLWVSGAAGLLVFFYLYNPYPDAVGFARHCGHFFLLLVAACWLAGAAPRALTVLFAVHAAAGAYAAAMDVAFPFSGSEEAAAVIERAGWKDMPIVGDLDHATAPVAARLDREFYYPAVRQRGRPVPRRWVDPQLLRREVAHVRRSTGRDVLVVLNYPLSTAEPFVPLLSVESSIVANEEYWMYLARGPR